MLNLANPDMRKVQNFPRPCFWWTLNFRKWKVLYNLNYALFVTAYFTQIFLIYSSWFKRRLYTNNQLHMLHGKTLKSWLVKLIELFCCKSCRNHLFTLHVCFHKLFLRVVNLALFCFYLQTKCLRYFVYRDFYFLSGNHSFHWNMYI